MTFSPAKARQFIAVLDDIIERSGVTPKDLSEFRLSAMFAELDTLALAIGVDKSSLPIAEFRYHSPERKPLMFGMDWSNEPPVPPAEATSLSLVWREKYGVHVSKKVWFLDTIREGAMRGLPTKKYVAAQADFAQFNAALREWQRWAQLQLDEYERQPANATKAETRTTDDDDASANAKAKGPADLQDYVSAADVISKHSPPGVVLNHKRLKRFLDLHSSIRTTRPIGKDGKPRKNRLLIHLADWHRNREALSEWDSADRDPIEKTTDDEIALRLEAVRSKKKRGQ